MEKVNLGRDKFKDTRGEKSTKFSYSNDIIYGCSWPQRNFRCSFCMKEFKSAQALGGHMNIHRRDRAKLRLSSSSSSSSLDGLNQNPNPNLNDSSLPSPSPSPVSKFLPHMNYQCSDLTSPSSTSRNVEKTPTLAHPLRDPARSMEKRAFPQMEGIISLTKKNDSRVWKKRDIFSLDLFPDVKEDLDLELRLGYA